MSEDGAQPGEGAIQRGELPHEPELRKALEAALLRVDRKPDDIEGWTLVALLRTFLDMNHEAVSAFERILDLQPTQEDFIWLELAKAAMRSGRYDRALQAFDELIKLYRDEPIHWIFKSIALENLGRTQEAHAALREAADLDPTDPDKKVQIAFALGLLGRYDEALALDEESIQQNELNAYAWANKGTHLAKKGRADEAVEAFERAVALAPRDPTILRNYGVTLGDLGRYEDARRWLTEARRINGRDVATLRSLGFVFTKLGDDERALEADSTAVELAPHHPIAWRSKGIDLFRLGRYEEALAAFACAAGLAPARAEMWQSQGSALWMLGEHAEAAAAFERAAAADEKSTDALLGRGAALDAVGQHAEALEVLRKAVALAPKRPELWALLGCTHRNLGNSKAAEHAFRRGFEIDPTVAMASGVVDALAAQEREQEALDFLKRGRPRDPDEALLAYWRGVLLTRLDRHHDAVRELAVATRQWRARGVDDARSASAVRAVRALERSGHGAVSWSEHWFGRGSSTTTRILGAVLLLGLFAALVVPLAVPDALAALEYGAGWAAITLPVTVLVLLLALPTVQTIKAGKGSFEITTIVVTDREQLGLDLPTEVPIAKIPDLPSLLDLPSLDPAMALDDLLDAVRDVGGESDAEAAGGRSGRESR